MKQNRPVFHEGRKQQRHFDTQEDAYRSRKKPEEPVDCPDCGASFDGGRWSWTAGQAHARKLRCPACRRIAEDMPGGIVEVSGLKSDEHAEEVLRLAHNIHERERAAHPMQRLMGEEKRSGGILLKTTDSHLARAISGHLHKMQRSEIVTHEGGVDGPYRVEVKYLP